MIFPQDHPKEQERLQALNSYSILDTLPEEDFDNLTAIAAEICGTPISLVSLLDNDRQWFKSHYGLDVTETPKEYAFCAHAINHPDDIFIVQDSRADERFKDNPLVTGDPRVIFYAGVPLSDADGLPLGTLCVIDHKPRLLSLSQLRSLKALSNQVMNLLRLRKRSDLLKESLEILNQKNKELEQFAFVAAHDLKSPLNNIFSIAELLSEQYASVLDKDGNTMLTHIKTASSKLTGLIDGLLDYSRSETILHQEKSIIDLQNFRNEIYGLFSYDNSLSLSLKSSLESISMNKAALDQIVINLISNAIKYTDKDQVVVEIGAAESEDHIEFYVQDNGPGIPEEHQDTVFQIFKVLAATDKFGRKGNGIGLATVKKLIERLGGTIKLSSKPGEGCKFTFQIKKVGTAVEETVLV